MGLFSSPKVPDTISDKDYKKLQERAAKTAKASSMDARAARDRHNASAQKSKARWS